MNLGTLVKNKRKSLKLSQKDLAKNICTQSTISRLEEGKITPSIDLLFKLSLKLQTPAEYFIDLLLNEQSIESNLFMKKYNSLLRNNHYESVINELKKENLNDLNVWKKIYIEYLTQLSNYYLNKVNDTSCIKALVNISNEINDVNQLNLLLKIQIFNSIGNIYGENGEKKKALFYYNKILSTIIYDNYDNIRNLEFLLIVRFNKCKTLFELGKIEEANTACDESIEICKKSAFIGLLGHFLYYKAQCTEKFNRHNETEISQLYKEAFWVFKFLNLTSLVEHLLKNKSKYL